MELPRKTVRSILIIDDDREDYELVLEAIHEINPSIKVYYIGSCEEAKKFPDFSFDLVLLDINMPQHDGFAWLHGIRKKGYADLPIVMYTNSLSPTHISRAYEEGANLYFSKPETFSSLLAGLRKLVSMDWSLPFAITKNYHHQGHFQTFQF